VARSFLSAVRSSSRGGVRLFAHVEPFFSNLDAVKQRLAAGTRAAARGASEVVLQLTCRRARTTASPPSTCATEVALGFDTELADWLRDGDVDSSSRGARPTAPRTRHQRLLRFRWCCWCRRNGRSSRLRRCGQTGGRAPLISLPERESTSVVFQRGLRKRRVTWPVTIEASSLELIMQYVADGRGPA